MDSTRVTNNRRTDAADLHFVDDGPPDVLEASTRYRILEELGRGGMGVVYRAEDVNLQRDVALKLLRSEFVENRGAVEQFTNEARIMGSLQHPGVPHIYDHGLSDDGRPFHSLKIIEGTTFGNLLDERRNTSEAKARLLNIFSFVCQTIAYTHAQGYVHLDLKPGNIMVGEFGEVHVMDWGLARFIGSGSDHERCDSLQSTEDISPVIDEEVSDQSNHVRGTLKYMAPEQARAESVDKRTDVFCLGAILCEILTGHAPYPGTDHQTVLTQAQNASLEHAYHKLDHCHYDLNVIRLAKRCLDPQPDRRPEDGRAIAVEMASYSDLASQQIEADMARFFELSHDLFCICGFDGFFRRINSKFSEALGYTERELLARPFMDFVVEEDRQPTLNAMSRLKHGQPVVRFCNRYRKANGQLVEFEWSAQSIVDEKVIFAVARNLSEGVS